MLGVTSPTLFTYFANAKDLNFVREGGGGKIVKAVFTRVYRRLAANSIEKHVKKGTYQKLLARIVRKVAFPKSLLNAIILHFSILVTTKMSKVLEFYYVRINIYKFPSRLYLGYSTASFKV